MHTILEAGPQGPNSGGFATGRAEKGTVKFIKSQVSDAHIQKAIKILAEKTDFSEQKIIEVLDKKMAKYEKLHDTSPLLYNTIKLNVVESSIFEMMKKIKGALDNAPKFNNKTFNHLVNLIRVEYPRFFPLRDFVHHKTIHNPRFIIVPGLDKTYDDIDTAAATPDGEFIFNKIFCQRLLNFAHVKGLQPKSDKYTNNGGDIPSEWSYIEFLIIHEFMHYTQGDFYYADEYKEDNKVINWVGDFRTNYLLVKSGLEQLPMGLFNDEINLDRQSDYQEMIDVVKAEFARLSKEDQEELESGFEDMDAGRHPESEENDEEEEDPDWDDDDPNAEIDGTGEPGFDGADGADGKDGRDGRAGKDGVEPGSDGEDGEDGEDGGDGEDGKDGGMGGDGYDGFDEELDDDGNLVSPATPGWNGGPGGKGGNGGKPGKGGKGGKGGRPGPPDANGKVGRPGRDGKPGKDGQPGKAGKGGEGGNPGKPGKGYDPEKLEKWLRDNFESPTDNSDHKPTP